MDAPRTLPQGKCAVARHLSGYGSPKRCSSSSSSGARPPSSGPHPATCPACRRSGCPSSSRCWLVALPLLWLLAGVSALAPGSLQQDTHACQSCVAWQVSSISLPAAHLCPPVVAGQERERAIVALTRVSSEHAPHSIMQQLLQQRWLRWEGTVSLAWKQPCWVQAAAAPRLPTLWPHISTAEMGRSALMPGSCFHSVFAAEVNTSRGNTNAH